MAIETAGWVLVDEDFDLQPETGSFISQELNRRPFRVFGETVNALNPCHAAYVWLWDKLEKRGRDRWHCDYCNHLVRYVSLFQDPAGDVFMLGWDCAMLVEAKVDLGEQFDRSAFYAAKRRAQMIQGIRQRMTRNGERYVVSNPVPAWIWNLKKEARPSWLSLWKGDYGDWFYSIWGETHEEVVRHIDEFDALETWEVPPPEVDHSQFVGEVGKRQEFPNLTLTGQFHREDDYYGSYWINNFQDETGNNLSYKGNKLEVEVGQKVTLVATVKRHNEWKGKKETQLSRPKVK